MDVESPVWVGVESIWMATDGIVPSQQRVWRVLLRWFNV